MPPRDIGGGRSAAEEHSRNVPEKHTAPHKVRAILTDTKKTRKKCAHHMFNVLVESKDTFFWLLCVHGPFAASALSFLPLAPGEGLIF